VNLLLERGADPSIREALFNRTASQRAAEERHKEIAKILEKAEAKQKGPEALVLWEQKEQQEREDTSHSAAGPEYNTKEVFHSIWKAIGDNIHKYKTYPRIVGETGGKDFLIAHNDCDIDALAVACVRGAFEYQGQKCSALSRAYFPKSIWNIAWDKIKVILDHLLNKYRLLACAWYAQYPIDEYFETTIEQELAKVILIDHPDFRKFVLIFTDPKEMTEVSEEKWKLMKLAKKFKRNKERLARLSAKAKLDINRHLDKFAYINRGLATSKPYTSQDMIDRIKEIYSTKVTDTPDILFNVLDEQVKRLKSAQGIYGDYISPDQFLEAHWAIQCVPPEFQPLHLIQMSLQQAISQYTLPDAQFVLFVGRRLSLQ